MSPSFSPGCRPTPPTTRTWVSSTGTDPSPSTSHPPEPVEPAELRRRIVSGEWVVDLRNRTAFAAGHLGGSLAFELSDPFVAYLGWLYTWGAPLTLIGESDTQITEAQRELVRIGIDSVTGATTKPVETLTEGTELRSYRVADFGELAAAVNGSDDGDIVILDVRRSDEHRSHHIRGAHNIPVHEVADRLTDLPDGEIWVHCATGYRASIAASLLDRAGRSVVLIDDDFDNAVDLHFA